jgi:hypothetical protein
LPGNYVFLGKNPLYLSWVGFTERAAFFLAMAEFGLEREGLLLNYLPLILIIFMTILL